MECGPRLDTIELHAAANASSSPARETLEAVMRLKIARLVVQRRTRRSVYPVQPKLFFEIARQRLIGVDGFVGVMDLQRLRVDLIHGDVKMLMLLFTMADRDVLVLLEPSGPHRPAHEVLKLLRRQARVFWVKRNHEMVGLLSLRPHVALLEQLHDLDRQVSVLPTVEAIEIPARYHVHRSLPFPRSMYGTSFDILEVAFLSLGSFGVMIIGSERGVR